MRSILPLFTLLAITSALAAPGRGGSKSWGQCSNDLTAKTKAGTFTGFIGSETPDVAQWLGVPYGAPPIGDQRFLPPKPAAYAGDMLTTSYKPICMQNGGPGSGVFWEVVPQFQNMDPQAEDCLYLNIWGPTKAIGGGGKSNGNQKQEKLPVIIWICGGGFQEGGGHAAYQVPDHWVQRTQTHLVVTFNYRLSVWGYPGARAAPVNAGLADIRMVVEWLRDNVEAFGGDPDHMVLWGQSAGGNAANSYGYANGEDPIVAGIVAQSGTTSQINSPNTTVFTTLAAQFGCDGLDAEAELQCMQKADNDMLHDVIRNGDNVPRFSPVADGFTLFENNTARLEQGKVAKVPLILGNTINEGAAFASPDSAPPMNVTFPFLQSVGCGVKTEAGLRMQYGLETYRYLSAGNFSNITPKYWLGAMHSSDIPLVFGTHYEFRGNSSELEWETSYSMEGFWYSLAAQTSDSPMDGLGHTWPEFGKSQEMVMFGNKTGPTLIVPGNYYDDVYMCDSVMNE